MTGHKIFISYKYADDSVCTLSVPQSSPSTWVYRGRMSLEHLHIGQEITFLEPAKVRDYVDRIQERLEKIGYTWKGEDTNEDLSGYTREYIWEKLKDKIYDSSVTLVLISPHMKDSWDESSQWINKEIEYSLKRVTRNDKASNPNAIVAVVLPDLSGSYGYYCYNSAKHFEILEENIEKGYAELVTWGTFMKDPKKYIERAIEKRDDDGIQPVKTA